MNILFQAWRPIEIGKRVELKTRWRRGCRGTVIERHDDLINGMACYSVRLDIDGQTADMRRHELRIVK